MLGEAPDGAETLATVESAPIARLVEQMLSQSDNMLAEALARQVALARELPASFEGGADAVTEALTEAGVDVTGVTLSDASGLSKRRPGARVRARRRGARRRPTAASRAPPGCSPACRSPATTARCSTAGTTTRRTAPGTVRAKTGTLLGVHALAGTAVTADGRLLAFAVVADGATGSEVAVEGVLDDIAATLAGCGCR